MIDFKNISTDEYFKAFYIAAANFSSHKKAYEAVEQKYRVKFGAEKYTSYESFRNAKSLYLKSLKNK